MSSSTATVLVVTSADDATADAVIAELCHRAARVVRFDIGDFPTRLRMAARYSGKSWQGRLWDAETGIDLADATAVYYRRPTRFRLPDGLSDGDAVFAAHEARLGVGGVLAALDALWVNDPTKIVLAEYKPVQLRIASQAGLHVPRTLITNDHAAATAFAAEVGGQIVCKTLSSVVLAEGDEPRITYTTRVDPLTIDPTELSVTAHQLQEWVPKAHEVRVTMVGHEPFAVAIHATSESGHIDWRADYAGLRYEVVVPPPEATAGMIRYLKALGLSYGAFDFVVTPSDAWVMLECNPAGQWLWLQHETDLPIAAGLAELLTTGAHR